MSTTVQKFKIKSIEWNNNRLIADAKTEYNTDTLSELNTSFRNYEPDGVGYHLIIGINEIYPNGNTFDVIYYLALQNGDEYNSVEVFSEFDGTINWREIAQIIERNIQELI